MSGRKVAAAAVMIVMAAMAAQPAMAGVGGCRLNPSCGSGQLTSNAPAENVPVGLNGLNGAVRGDYLAIIKALVDDYKKGGRLDQGTPSDQGVGGCMKLPGVGGCICVGIC